MPRLRRPPRKQEPAPVSHRRRRWVLLVLHHHHHHHLLQCPSPRSCTSWLEATPRVYCRLPRSTWTAFSPVERNWPRKGLLFPMPPSLHCLLRRRLLLLYQLLLRA